jgi:uncharacterized protein (DUF1697 family)
MPTHVALLRGINVGGNNLIRMPALAACFEDNGFESVSTYIQSGNVLFDSRGERADVVVERIERMLAAAFDYVPTVVVRTRREMQAIVEGAPDGFGSQPETYRYDVIFVKEPLRPASAIGQVPAKPGVDDVRPGPHVLYFSRLAAKATHSRMSKIVSSPIYPSVTIRNWNTTTRLLALMGSPREDASG